MGTGSLCASRRGTRRGDAGCNLKDYTSNPLVSATIAHTIVFFLLAEGAAGLPGRALENPHLGPPNLKPEYLFLLLD